MAEELTQEEQDDTQVVDEQDQPSGEEKTTPQEEDAITITIGDESSASDEDLPDDAPNLVGTLRELARTRAKELRERDRRIRELEERESARQPEEAAPSIGAEPTMESCDYDADKFAADLKAWHAKKAEVDAFNAKIQAKKDAEKDAWNAKIAAYEAEKQKLRQSVPDIDSHHEAVKAAFNVTQQAILVKHPKNAMLVAALGDPRYETKLKTLAKISDPVDFAFSLADLGGQLKVTKRSDAPAIEKPIQGQRVAGAITKNGGSAREQQLLKQAQETGNAAPYNAFMREKRRLAAAK